MKSSFKHTMLAAAVAVILPLSSIAYAAQVPAGAVMAFDLDDCPNGWSSFSKGKGRFIVGAGVASGLSARQVGDTGGAEKIALKPKHLPPHQHKAPFGAQPDHAHYGQGEVKRVVLGAGDGDHQVTRTSTVGEGKKMTNLPPFIALRYCKKN